MKKKTAIRIVFFSPAVGMVIGAIGTIFFMYREIAESDMIIKWMLAVGIPLEIIFVFLVGHVLSKGVLAEIEAKNDITVS